ncbi:hypothetical protein [Mycolicibacterium arenosum]|uniref:DUF732 domain-containing protein n=1 Tax=Mycolicibacterium arenosum TaxID=2952157 RepID=A0ABT1LX82_9MYCO|nr:hypothetical protein [Mycolicibacterium sp. CAU 1645]MCP9271486.1 hypothetical protein [Mycolicibacterium sp. CAU 1645]
MKKLIVVGTGAIGALALSTLLGGGVAAADDYAGQTYADASSAASDAGETVTVASRVGDKLSEDDCLVTRSQSTPFTSAIDGSSVDGIQFYLNCNGGVASATTPGNSLASEAGRTAQAAIDEEEAKAEAEAAAAQSEQAELEFAGEEPGVPGQVAGG